MRDLIKELQEEHNNGRSWEHCYGFFNEQRKKEGKARDTNLCALYLGFYLASFGMYRGSARIREYNYTKLTEIFGLLFDGRYEKLWGLDLNTIKDVRYEVLELIFDKDKGVYPQLKSCLANALNDDDMENYEPSDTLVSKILMGTMCCTPGYDTYFVEGLKQYEKETELENGRFGRSLYRKGFKPLLDFLANDSGYEKKIFDGLSEKLNFLERSNNEKVYYPPMRVVDLFFWIKGYNKAQGNQVDKYLNPLNPSKTL